MRTAVTFASLVLIPQPGVFDKVTSLAARHCRRVDSDSGSTTDNSWHCCEDHYHNGMGCTRSLRHGSARIYFLDLINLANVDGRTHKYTQTTCLTFVHDSPIFNLRLEAARARHLTCSAARSTPQQSSTCHQSSGHVSRAPVTANPARPTRHGRAGSRHACRRRQCAARRTGAGPQHEGRMRPPLRLCRSRGQTWRWST